MPSTRSPTRAAGSCCRRRSETSSKLPRRHRRGRCCTAPAISAGSWPGSRRSTRSGAASRLIAAARVAPATARTSCRQRDRSDAGGARRATRAPDAAAARAPRAHQARRAGYLELRLPQRRHRCACRPQRRVFASAQGEREEPDPPRRAPAGAPQAAPGAAPAAARSPSGPQRRCTGEVDAGTLASGGRRRRARRTLTAAPSSRARCGSSRPPHRLPTGDVPLLDGAPLRLLSGPRAHRGRLVGRRRRPRRTRLLHRPWAATRRYCGSTGFAPAGLAARRERPLVPARALRLSAQTHTRSAAAFGLRGRRVAGRLGPPDQACLSHSAEDDRAVDAALRS